MLEYEGCWAILLFYMMYIGFFVHCKLKLNTKHLVCVCTACKERRGKKPKHLFIWLDTQCPAIRGQKTRPVKLYGHGTFEVFF